METTSKQKIQNFVHILSKYSIIFYIMVIVSLIFFQSDIFKDTFPKEYIVDGIIAVSSFAIGSILLDKIISKNVRDPKPFLYCPECDDAKMRTTGEWICEKCTKTFGSPKKE